MILDTGLLRRVDSVAVSDSVILSGHRSVHSSMLSRALLAPRMAAWRALADSDRGSLSHVPGEFEGVPESSVWGGPLGASNRCRINRNHRITLIVGDHALTRGIEIYT